VVTNHYQVPDVDKLRKKLKTIDDKTLYDPNGKDDGYLKPQEISSSVRIAFAKDRNQAIVDFGFVPGIAMWSLSELEGNLPALELLRQGPTSTIRWHATHACPVGNQCPKEIVASIGDVMRCGLCPLACKCVDNLPPIHAKQNELKERIRTTVIRIKSMEECGIPQAELDAHHRRMALDTKELLGWQLSAEILHAKSIELGTNDGSYHADQPEVVRKQLKLVTRCRTESEFFLQRIAESNAYPSLESPEVRAKAARYTRVLMARQGNFQEAALLNIPDHTELILFASTLRSMIKAKQFSISEVAAAVDAVPDDRETRVNIADNLLLKDTHGG
jgi:hypothetical protein